jgi:uncharacterized membrane protein (UPF0127 family)
MTPASAKPGRVGARSSQPVIHRLEIMHARTFRQRLVGLLGAAPLRPGSALRISSCRAVHTIGMRHAIDVVFVDHGNRVLAVHASLRPWHVAACLRASATFEFREGEASRLGIVPGDCIVGA